MPINHEDHSADLVKEIGMYTQKILVTLNAGGIVTLLTFIGNLESNTTVIFDVEAIKKSLFAFLFGLGFVGLSLFVTYWQAQLSIARPEKDSGHLLWFFTKMVGPVLMSFAAFCFGIIVAATGISTP